MFKKLVCSTLIYIIIFIFSPSGFSQSDFFLKKPLIKIVYINPDDPKSGFRSIEGIEPENNSILFKLERLSSFHTPDYSSFNFRFSSRSGELTLWSKYENNSLYHDYIGERRLTITWKKESRKIEQFIFLDGTKRVEITLPEEGSHILEPAVYKKVSIELASLAEDLKETQMEDLLAEFVWANSFLPENEATPIAVTAGTLFGVLPISQDRDSPFVEYTRCVEQACEDCGGEWGPKPFGLVGCSVLRERGDSWLKVAMRSAVLTLCFVPNSTFCLKYLPLPK